MASLFPALKKSSSATSTTSTAAGGKDISWDDFDEDFTGKSKKAKDNCDLCKDIDWQDQDELNVCKACGTVLERPLDMGAEYRFFSSCFYFFSEFFFKRIPVN